MMNEEIITTLKQISDLLYLLRCNMTSISRYVNLDEDNSNKEKYKKLAKVSVDNILEAINKDLNKDYTKFANELFSEFEKEKRERAKEIIKFLKEKGIFTYDYADEPHSPIIVFSDYILEELSKKFGIEEKQGVGNEY